MSNYSSSSSSESLICKDFFIVKPEDASFRDLFRLLFRNDRRNLIDCPSEFEQDLRKFNYRWLVFLSALLLKVFQLIKTPLAYLGVFIESSINLVQSYGGLLKLFLNFIRGKVVMPNKSSETFKSMAALTDSRVELDPKNEANSVKFYASLAWMSAKLSYENSAYIKNIVENTWKMKLIDTYNFHNEFQKTNSTNTFMLRNETKDTDTIVVAFKGTGPFNADDWCSDIDISWYGLKGVGRVHSGFMKALGLQNDNNVVGWPKEIELGQEKPQYAYYAMRQVLRNIIKENKNAKFLVVGHSLGGALAILFVSVLMLHEEKELLDRMEGVYTYGQPRVGDGEFGEFMKKKLKTYNVKYRRYVYCNDMVPRVPFDDKTLLFQHFGPTFYYNSLYKGKVLPEEPNKNYLSFLSFIPKYMNAAWELIRGFILPYKYGPQYKENWCEKGLRLVGLLIPGLSAHCPQDYTNISMLGRLISGLNEDNAKVD